MVGERIRQARLAQQRSLADVAKKAQVSVASLSRIENDKQTLELGLFLTIARVLDQTPSALLGDGAEEGDGMDPLVRKVAAFDARERALFWRELAAARRNQTRTRPGQIHQLALQVEELVEHMEFVRVELESVRKRLRRARGR